METLQAIFSRQSVRQYANRSVALEHLRAILCVGKGLFRQCIIIQVPTS